MTARGSADGRDPRLRGAGLRRMRQPQDESHCNAYPTGAAKGARHGEGEEHRQDCAPAAGLCYRRPCAPSKAARGWDLGESRVGARAATPKQAWA